MLNNSLYQTIMRDFNRRQAEQKHQQDMLSQPDPYQLALGAELLGQ